MIRSFAAALVWLTLTAAAHAACDGRDLRATLTPQEEAQLAAQLAPVPFPEGNHWRAERDGQVIHLVGTIHLDDPRLDAPAARLKPLIDRAAVVLLEMTAAERDTLMSAMAERPEMLTLQDTTLPELMQESDWQALAEAMRARGLPPFVAAKFRPWYVSMLLAIPPCLAQTMAQDDGLDTRIEAMATAAGVPTRALEPWDTALSAFADMPLDMQLSMIRTALVPPAAAEDQFATLAASYFDERHAESWAMSGLLAARLGGMAGPEADAAMQAMADTLLDSRNRAWVPVILDAAETADGPVVAAFGAAHLFGETGLPALLEAEGFTLSRLPF